jgi:hypothetical protein
VCEWASVAELAGAWDFPISAHLSLKLSSILFNKLVSIELSSKLLLWTLDSRSFFNTLFIIDLCNCCGCTWIKLSKFCCLRLLGRVWPNIINLFINRNLFNSIVGFVFCRASLFKVYWFDFLVRLAATTLRRATGFKASIVCLVLSLKIYFIYWSKIYFLIL